MITLNEHRAEFRKALIGRFITVPEVKSGFAGWFPNVTYDAEMLSIEVQRNKRKIAVDVERCTDPHRNKFTRSTEKLFVPPMYKESIDFCKCDGYRDTFGSGAANFVGGRARAMANSAYSELRAIRNMVLRAIELQRSQVLQYGYVQLKNGDSIDYKRKAESMETVTVAWSDPDSTPLADLQAGMQFIRTQGQSGDTTMNAIMGSQAFADFYNNTALMQSLDIRRLDRGSLGMPQFDNVSGMTYHGQFAAGDFRVNIWTYSETYEDPTTGNEIPYLEADNVVLLPNDFIGETSYATTPLIAGEGVNRYVKMQQAEYTIYDIIDQVKTAWELIYQSSPLVVPVTVDRIYTLKTTV